MINYSDVIPLSSVRYFGKCSGTFSHFLFVKRKTFLGVWECQAVPSLCLFNLIVFFSHWLFLIFCFVRLSLWLVGMINVRYWIPIGIRCDFDLMDSVLCVPVLVCLVHFKKQTPYEINFHSYMNIL